MSKVIDGSLLTRLALTIAISVAALTASAVGVRAETVIGADGAPGPDCDPFGFDCSGRGGDGESVNATGNPAAAYGGNGGFAEGGGGFSLGGDGGAAVATAATSIASGPAEADAIAFGGAGGNALTYDCCVIGGTGADANATSSATSSGSGRASATATAYGGSGGFADEGIAGGGGSATATASATALGGGAATAKATATGGARGFCCFGVGGGGGASATSNAEADFRGVSVKSTIAASVASTDGSYQADASTSALSIALPDKAYAATLIGDASEVASALLGPRDAVFGVASLGYAIDSMESETYSASSTIDLSNRSDLLLGLIDAGFDDGFGSLEFTIVANGVEILDSTFGSLAFFHDSLIDLGSYSGPVDLTFNLIAHGASGFNFDFAVGGAVPETSTWAMMLIGFAGLGFVGYRSSREARRLTAPGPKRQ